jgi:hypothetical protein
VLTTTLTIPGISKPKLVENLLLNKIVEASLIVGTVTTGGLLERPGGLSELVLDILDEGPRAMLAARLANGSARGLTLIAGDHARGAGSVKGTLWPSFPTGTLLGRLAREFLAQKRRSFMRNAAFSLVLASAMLAAAVSVPNQASAMTLDALRATAGTQVEQAGWCGRRGCLGRPYYQSPPAYAYYSYRPWPYYNYFLGSGWPSYGWYR